jgi:hypothetical protein
MPSKMLSMGETLNVQHEVEDHVWFEDRWMVTSCCDE